MRRVTHVLHIDSTVHGPVVNRDGRTISLEWTGLKPTKDFVAFWKISHAKNLDQFLAAADDLTVPPLNLVYADDAGNIAMYPCGEHPLRLVGQGRIPMDGPAERAIGQGPCHATSCRSPSTRRITSSPRPTGDRRHWVIRIIWAGCGIPAIAFGESTTCLGRPTA